MKNVFIVNAHQKWEHVSEGKLNGSLTEQAFNFFKDRGINVEETRIADGYDVEEQIEKHVSSDLVILQTPIFWFNPPATFKQWTDEVFMTAMFQKKMTLGDGRVDGQDSQYGTGGQMMGRKFFISATWNAPAEAFGDPEQSFLQGKSTEDILFNVSLNYRFMGYDLLPNFHCFNVIKDPKPEIYFKEYDLHLEKILGLLN